MSTTIEPSVPERCAGGPGPAGASAAALGEQRKLPHRLRADCLSDPAGGLTFSVPIPGGVPARGAALLLRRRGGARAGTGAAPEDTVRLPLVGDGSDGALRAVLPQSMPLPEGRWDVHLALGEREQRLLPGVHDLRSLVGRVPDPGSTWIAVRLPYATRFGNLTVRAWARRNHAEAGRLRVVDGGAVLDGTLYGPALTGAALLEARPRGARVGAEPVTSPAAAVPGGLGGPGAAFTAELPYAALTEAGVWDLWLLPGADGKPVRIARILDDIQDKKRVFRYPSQRLTAGAGEFAVRPYYTLDNDLAVRVDRIREAGTGPGS